MNQKIEDHTENERETVSNCPGCGLGRVVHGARGLAKAALHIGRATDEKISSRRQLCKSCPHAIKCTNPKNQGRVCKCKLCGCSLKSKTVIDSEKCPVNKW